MAYVQSIIDVTPPARYDDKPWTHVQIKEAVSSAGPWSVIDTQDIVPLDTDPAAPLTRNFSTTLAQYEQAWYCVVFTDAFSGVSDPTDPQLLPEVVESPSWFDWDTLNEKYYYTKIKTSDPHFVNAVLIPDAIRFVSNYANLTAEQKANPPEDINDIAQNYAVNKILADDENVKIAQARGQSSFTVSGDTINLDLSPGRNPLLSAEDELTLKTYRDANTPTLHTDKKVVASQTHDYEAAEGGTLPTQDVDYVRSMRVPGYFAGH